MPAVPPDQDVYGRMYTEALDGGRPSGVMEEGDGTHHPMDVRFAFMPPRRWEPYELRAMELVAGRVLDVGCGAGRHALHVQERGHDVVAIDESPGAIEVCRRRGVRDARVLSLADVSADLGTIDTVLMIYGNFGLFGSVDEARMLLRRLATITAPGARILGDSVDPYFGKERRDGTMSGRVKLRFLYAGMATPWFHLLNVSPDEMREIVDGTGWHVDQVLDDGGADYIGILRKQGT